MARATVDQLEAARNRSLELYAAAFDALQLARKTQPGSGPPPFLACGSPYGRPDLAAPEREPFLARVRQDVDRGVWALVIQTTKLEALMDHKALAQFRAQLAADPPEATADNIFATMRQFQHDAGDIFRRGVAEAFASLDRRFRSHDGFKIGTRIILSYALQDWGGMHSTAEDRLRDVERAFLILDGKPPVERYAESVTGLISEASRGSLKLKPFELENGYFKVRGFKNRCVHVWFKRPDLVKRVNTLLADYYGEVIGAASDVAEKTHQRTTAVARNMGFFRTPEDAASRLMAAASVPTAATHSGKYHPLDILEPSAGDGALASRMRQAGHRVACVELHPGRAAGLRPLFRTVQGDFLEMSPDELGRFDRIVMNPPFDRGLDMDHVSHAFRFLKPGGILAAIMSAGTAYREDKRTEAFRSWCERFRAQSYGELFDDLPRGSFLESGTSVNACIVTLRRPA